MEDSINTISSGMNSNERRWSYLRNRINRSDSKNQIDLEKLGFNQKIEKIKLDEMLDKFNNLIELDNLTNNIDISPTIETTYKQILTIAYFKVNMKNRVQPSKLRETSEVVSAMKSKNKDSISMMYSKDLKDHLGDDEFVRTISSISFSGESITGLIWLKKLYNKYPDKLRETSFRDLTSIIISTFISLMMLFVLIPLMVSINYMTEGTTFYTFWRTVVVLSLGYDVFSLSARIITIFYELKTVKRIRLDILENLTFISNLLEIKEKLTDNLNSDKLKEFNLYNYDEPTELFNYNWDGLDNCNYKEIVEAFYENEIFINEMMALQE